AYPVGTAFEVSYGQLDPTARRLLRLLACHPGPDLSRSAAAALAGLPLDAIAEQLTGLVARGLVRATEPGRYELHDLIRGLAGTIWGWLDAAYHHAQALPALERAVGAAVADGNRSAEGRALHQLGMAHDRLGNQ